MIGELDVCVVAAALPEKGEEGKEPAALAWPISAARARPWIR